MTVGWPGASGWGVRLSVTALATAFGCAPGEELPVYWAAPAFALTTQAGDTLRDTDLEGSVWVASFVFTNCTGVCPLVSATMARLRDSLAAAELLGAEVRLLSLSVDPARDTPEVLRRYAQRFGGSPPEHWAFLTGEPAAAVRRLVEDGFKLTARLDAGEGAHAEVNYQVLHSSRVLLVDRTGRVRGAYDAVEPDVVDRIMDDVDTLLGERRGKPGTP